MLSADHKALWRLAGPIMVSNITVALLGIVDTAVVGHLDEPFYLGGVTLAMVLINFLYWGLSFLRMGTTGTVAQQFGGKQYNQIRSSLAHAMLLALLLGIAVIVLQGLISGVGFSILHGSDNVKFYANRYFDIAIWSVPAMLVNLVLTGWLLGMQKAKPTLILSVFINVLNIILDILFVVVFKMDVVGVALATVIAQYSGIFLGIILCRSTLKKYRGDWIKQEILDWEKIREMISVNHNLFLRTLSLIFVFGFFTHQGAGQSDDILAANAILKNFYLVMALALDGFAIAAEALAGEAIGKKNHLQFWLSVKLSMIWSFLFSILFCIVYFFLGNSIIALMTSIETVQSTAGNYLIWIIITPIISVWCFVWDGVFVGARKAVEMRNSMILSTVFVFIPVWYFTQQFGNHGLWFAFIFFLMARTISMTIYALLIERQKQFV